MAIGFSLPGVPFKASTSAPDLTESISKGFALGVQPKSQAESLLNAMLQNKIKEAEAKYADKLQEANLELKHGQIGLLPFQKNLIEAQAKRQQQLANMPFSGQLSGTAKEAYALDLMRQQLGEDSPAYQNAKKSYELNLKSQEALNDYRQSLMGTANKRAATTLGKLEQEQQEVDQGYMPGTNGSVQLSPEQQQELSGQYQLQRLKLTTDTDTRKKALFATNIDKTLDAINVKDLTQFGGLSGGILKKMEEGKAFTGQESEAFDKYQKSLTAAKLLAKQVRQFYGDSITPGVQEQLSLLTNPATWINNPKIATQKFNQFKNILKNETETYRDAAKNINIFKGKYQSPDQFNEPVTKDLIYNPETGRLE